MRLRALILTIVCACGPETGEPPPPTDMEASPLCGIEPGDPGNSVGVGKYCDGFADCAGQPANICATAGDPEAHFCTTVCDPARPVLEQCGDLGALCKCSGARCGCTPGSCDP